MSLVADCSTFRVDTAVIKQRVPILLKYLDSDTEKELQALYALQASIVKLDQPASKFTFSFYFIFFLFFIFLSLPFLYPNQWVRFTQAKTSGMLWWVLNSEYRKITANETQITNNCNKLEFFMYLTFIRKLVYIRDLILS